ERRGGCDAEWLYPDAQIDVLDRGRFEMADELLRRRQRLAVQVRRAVDHVAVGVVDLGEDRRVAEPLREEAHQRKVEALRVAAGARHRRTGAAEHNGLAGGSVATRSTRPAQGHVVDTPGTCLQRPVDLA